MSETNTKKPIRLAVHKFASCDGCQLSVLALEDDLLALAEKVDFHHFPEASSDVGEGPFDVSLVEGSITTAHDQEHIRWVREQSRYVVAIGACATHGGIQALKNFARVDDFIQAVYASPQYIHTLATSTAIADHINVDFELQGCPINKAQLKEVILAFAADRAPQVSRHTVCLDCKLRGTVCVMVAKNELCLGPITQMGCGALCPAYGRGCYGCFGPSTPAETESFVRWLQQEGHANPEIARALNHVTCHAPAFAQAHARLEESDG